MLVEHGRGGDGGVEEGVGHEGEDGVEGEGADGGEAVDVTEVEFSAEEEEGAEEGEEEDWAGEVGVVHYMLVDVGDGVEDGEGLDGWERGRALVGCVIIR